MRRLQTGLLIWAAWTALAVFFGVTTSLTYVSQGRAPVWSQALAFSLAQWWIWAALTPLVVLAARRLPIHRGRVARHVPIHVVLAVVVAFIKVTIEGSVRQWLFGVRPYLLINNLALQVLIYGALVAMVHAIDHYGRSRERAAAIESRLRDAQLDLLRAQLRPHFLFNALNTISELVHEDPERADVMLGHLSALLRASIDAGDRQVAPLEDEIQLVEHYLAIQRVRFGDRLTVHVDVPEDCRLASVPHLVLQPLVENAIVHGISPRAEGGTLWITASRRPGAVVVKVEDDGVGLPPSRTGSGVGLANTRARLAAMYGELASLDVANRPGGGVIVALTVGDRPALASRTAVHRFSSREL